MLPFIRFKTMSGDEVITAVGSVSIDKGADNMLVYPHADANSTAHYIMEPSITPDDVATAINSALYNNRVVTVVGSKILTETEDE